MMFFNSHTNVSRSADKKSLGLTEKPNRKASHPESRTDKIRKILKTIYPEVKTRLVYRNTL